ncbi:MAG: hypothetical protein KF680_02390 [Cryobacterium sp.]|nr:hypothetical protein [Cryobacterium sp.]
MSDKRDDQNFDDWFASHFADGQEKPTTGAVPPPQPPPPVPPQPVMPPGIPDYTVPQQPQFPSQPPQVPPQPPATFDPSLGGASLPPQPVGAPEPYPLTEPAMPQEWVNPPVYDEQGATPAFAAPPRFPQNPTTQYPQVPVPPTVDFGLEGQDAVPTEFIPSTAQTATDINALDALFGEDRFQEYQDALVSPTPPPSTPAAPDGSGDEPPAGISKLHVTMMWVAGSVVAALALFAFFLVGTRLPMLTGSTSTGPSSAPIPVETERPVGPVEPGTYNWNELLGGECIEDFRGAWENEYTVVDCALPHSAQLVVRAAVPVLAGTGGTYPGVFDLQSRMNLLCTDAAVIDYEAAKGYDDVQFEASFPPSAEEWDTGRRDYFCFVSLASGALIEGSLAAPPAPDVPATEEEGADEGGTEGD